MVRIPISRYRYRRRWVGALISASVKTPYRFGSHDIAGIVVAAVLCTVFAWIAIYIYPPTATWFNIAAPLTALVVLYCIE